MDVMVHFILISPFIPLIVLYCLAYKDKKRRMDYLAASLFMSGLCSLVGDYLVNKAMETGWDGLKYTGLIYGGSYGIRITFVLILVVFIQDRIKRKKLLKLYKEKEEKDLLTMRAYNFIFTKLKNSGMEEKDIIYLLTKFLEEEAEQFVEMQKDVEKDSKKIEEDQKTKS